MFFSISVALCPLRASSLEISLLFKGLTQPLTELNGLQTRSLTVEMFLLSVDRHARFQWNKLTEDPLRIIRRLASWCANHCQNT